MKSHRLPLFFIISVLLLIGFSLATFYVASLAERYTLGHFGSYYSYFQKTLLLLGFSLIIAVMLQFVNYRVLRYLTIPAYVIGTGLLATVLFIGTGTYGSRRWIPIAGSFGLQPSEIQKLVIILVVALILTLPQKRLTVGLKILLVIAAVVPSVLLVKKEPDLGSASLLLGIAVVMLVHFRLTGRQLLVLGLVLALV